MKIPFEINVLRKHVMKILTRDIGKSSVQNNDFRLLRDRKILITRPNHRLGNLLLITPLVQEVTYMFPGCRIDLFVGGSAAPHIFMNYENIEKIIQLPRKPFSNILKYIRVWLVLRVRSYDLVINANEGSSSGRLSTLFARSKVKFFGEADNYYKFAYPDHGHHAKCPVYNFRGFLIRQGFEENKNQIPPLDLRLCAGEIAEGEKILNAIVQNKKLTICLFTNATGNKCYSNQWWEAFYNGLVESFPDYNFIEMLPVENISRLDSIIPSFYSTNIREIGAIIANASLFIAADSGVMHLASAVGTPTIGLFSVTSEQVYAPYNKHSLAINTGKITIPEMFALIEHTLLNTSYTKGSMHG
ncbi:glycosyltransferase family 9 protein [Flavobacterium zepuense]|uniref:Glycosyltransferase family 9 protein n=1 Tax=Flavobacterium zepuense TaxID=2593302 RepID=A0A552V9N8_9FLAO|nr:glycosyltransferase family 9 protein [Flavobacterium zepuense]TRW27159.1 glycosyltransferase family 9 protein [Flavobacterium zepuense]